MMYHVRSGDEQINGKVKILKEEGKAEDVKAGVEQDPDAEVAIACPLCGAMFDLRTGDGFFLLRLRHPKRYMV